MGIDSLKNTQKQKLYEPWLSLSSSIEEVKNNKLPINYSKIMLENTRVLFFAERHDNPNIRDHVARHARELREAGITHYAIEASEEINSILERLNQGEQVDLSKINIGPGVKGYERAVRAMQKQGIRIVAIDINQETKPSGEEREARITENISRIIETDPNSKVAVLIGSFHTSRNYSVEGVPQAGRRLGNAGIPTINVHFIGGRCREPTILTDPIIKAGLRNQEFMLNFKNYENRSVVPFGKGEADWVIHLP